MPDYRRNRIPGATYFFTINLFDRSSDLLVVQIDALREAVRTTRSRSPFRIDAWVVLRRGERGIWQRRYWEHTIRDERDFATHMDYIHFHPVKHGLAEHPGDWPFSSLRRCVAAGFYPSDWLGGVEPAKTGER